MTRDVVSRYIFICAIALTVVAPLDIVHAKSDVIVYAFRGGADGADTPAQLEVYRAPLDPST
jgi:hypothetical protein